MRPVTALFLASLSLTGCQRESGSARGDGEEVPELMASGGQLVPPGFVTRFTRPGGETAELAYSQMWADLQDGKLVILLSAGSPADGIRVALDLSKRKPARLEDIAGAWLTALPPSANGFVYRPSAGERRATSASVSIETVDDQAVAGTFFADLGGGEAIVDGAFRAARSPNLAPESLGALTARSR